MLSFFPLDVLDEIWDVIESVSERFLTYSSLLCADDIVLLSNTAEGLQNTLDKLGIFFETWNLKINIAKT